MNSSKVFKFMTAGVITILLLVSFMLGSQYNSGTASAVGKDENSGGIIAVSGEGVVRVKPDIAYLSLGVQTRNANAKVAQSNNATKMNNVMAALKQQGIKDEDIQTTQYSIYPNHRYNPSTGQSTIDGYIVQNTVRVVIRNIDNVGAVIDEVAKNDSNIINSIDFGLSDTSKHYLVALTKATEDAKVKADTIAKSIDVKISKPSKVIEAQSYSEPILHNRAMLDAKLESTPISSGMLEVRASVLVEYKY